MTRLSPQLRRQFKRFRSIRRGYGSFLILVALAVVSLGAELLVNNRALLVRYRGRTYFPAYGAIHTGREFGFDYDYEADYRSLPARFAAAGRGDWVLLAPLPYGPNENCYPDQDYKPRPPDFARRHYLGTDQINRDILARLLYGLRNSLIFSAGFVVLTYVIGVAVGCAMGYFGGTFDLGMQRFIEIWSLLPFLLVVIIIRSALPPGVGFGIGTLLGIVVIFSWTGMTYYVRSSTYRERAREYVAAAQVLGSGPIRVIFRHILPNILSTLITFLPFTIAGAIGILAALDYLGFGLPPPMPSWGELLKEGTSNLDAPWIVISAFGALSIALILITFVGEAIREAFDPKKFTVYR
jgi:microcin C transport system permease protein